MAITSSFELAIGASAPPFELEDLVGVATVRSADLAGRPLLVMFLCAHCPYVVHVEDALAQLGRDHADRVAIVAIASNDPQRYEQDSPDGLRAQAARVGFTFPYLYDESQQVALAYGAACTPDLFLFDDAHRLAYRGRLDDSRPGSGKPVTGTDLRAALDAVLAGEPVTGTQYPSIGCGIKWKPGNDPNPT